MVIMLRDRISRSLSLITGLSWLFTIIFLIGQPRSFFLICSPLARWWSSYVGYSQSDATAFLGFFHAQASKIFFVASFIITLYSLIFVLVNKCFVKARSEVSKEPTEAKSWELSLVVLFVVIGAFLRIHGLTRGFTYDELFTTVHFVETSSFWQTVSSYRVFNNHLFYSFAGRLCWLLLGSSEWVIRLPSLLAGLLTIPIFYHFSRRYIGKEPALVATFFLTVHPMHVVLSRSARGYSLLALGTLLTSWLFFELLERPRGRLGLMYVVTASLMVWSHLYGVIVVICQTVTLLILVWRSSVSKKSFGTIWLSFGFSGLATFILYTPVLPLLLLELRREKSGLVNHSFALEVMGQYLWTALVPILIIVLLIVILGLYEQRREKTTLLHFLYLFAPLIMAWLLRLKAVGFARFALFGLPSFLWFLSVGLSSISLRSFKKQSLVLLLIIVLIVSIHWTKSAWSEIDSSGFREALAALPENVPICAIGGDAPLFRYYGGERLFLPKTEADFYKLLKDKGTFYCLFHDVSWASTCHRQLFERHGKSARSFGDVLFFKVSP